MSGEPHRADWCVRATPMALIILVGVVASLGSVDAVSESPPDAPCAADKMTDHELTLARAVELALCGNAEIQSSAAAVRVRAAQVGQARAAYWPSLTASVTELEESTHYPRSQASSTSDTATTAYGAMTWRLFDFGGRRAGVRAAAKLLEAAFGAQDATIQKVLGSVVQAYFDAVTAKAVLESKTEDEMIASQTLASAERRVHQGDGAQSDALQARTALVHAAFESNRARATHEKSLAILSYTVGLPTGTSLEVTAGATASPTVADDKGLAAWLEDARQRHPAITAAQADLEAARAQVTAARSGGRPTVDLQANYYANGFPQQGLATTRQRSATVGIEITIPLFDGFLNRYKVREAQAMVQTKETALIDTQRLTLTEIIKAYADAAAAIGNLRESQSLLEAATASQTSSKRRYDAGAADILELLNTQAALADARQETVRSVADWHSARLRLLATSGLLSNFELQDP
jgi:outer membrane protein